MAKYGENDRYIASILQNITMSDLVLHDHVGWLTEQSSKMKVWCVVADMLFCVFVSKEHERPRDVVLLPGCTVRALVFKSAADNCAHKQVQLCKTISGLDKYQLVIDNSSTKTKYLFSADTRSELDQWTTILKGASTLDTDLFESGDGENGPRQSIPTSGSESESHRPLYSLRYLPSRRSLNRRDKMSQSHDESTEGGQRNSVHYNLNGSLHINGADFESLGDFRKYLRRESKDIDSETLKTSPMKAMHFETSIPARKKSGPMKLFKSFGNLESMLKPKRKRSPSPSGSIDESISTGSENSVDVSSSADFRQSRPRQKEVHDKRLSRSLDMGRRDSSNGSTGVRDFRRRKSSDIGIFLSDLNDIRYCGYLQYKSFLKWQTVWCVVCRGYFYGFRSQSHKELPRISVILTQCQVSYVSDHEKHQTKNYFFKLTKPNGKNIHLNASNHSVLCYWLQALQVDATKVQVDDDTRSEDRRSVSEFSFDSLLSSMSAPSSHDPNDCEPSAFVTDTVSFDSGNSIIFDDLRNLPHAKINHTGFRSDITDNKTTSADDWNNDSTTNACNLESSSNQETSPHHDITLKHLWQKDSGYLLNVIRQKMRRRKQSGDSTEMNKSVCGNNDLIVVEDKVPKSKDYQKREQRSSSRERPKRSSSFVTKKDLVMEDGDDGTRLLSPSTLQKRHKPLVVKKTASKELIDLDFSGYMEHKSFSGQWIRYWYILKDGQLYCYLMPDDTVTVDILDLPGYQVTSMVDKFRGKRFIVSLSHSLYTSNYLSVDTRQEMDAWESCLKTSIVESREENIGNPDITDSEGLNGAEAKEVAENDPYLKRQAIKQRLLDEMLRQKHQLEQKQVARQKKQRNWQKSSTSNLQFTADEQLLSDVTQLRQRRLSAQLKAETIQKQLQTTIGQKKKLFSFGHKKPKNTENHKNQHLQDQLKEFEEKIERLDKDLDQCKKDSNRELKQTAGNGSVKTTSSDDLNKSLEVMTLECQLLVTNGATVQRTNSLKASMQKFAHKAFMKGGRNKGNKKTINGTDAVANGEMSDTIKTDAVYFSPMLSFEDEQDDEQDSGYGLADHDYDSVTDLTKDICPHRLNENYNDDHFNLSSFDASSSPTTSPRPSRNRNMGVFRMSTSPKMSARRQIDPNVLAQIDAFEELTRQVLISRGEPPPAT